MKESMIPVTVHVGHEGATDAVVDEVREQVRRRKVVKAKRLRTTETGGSEKEFWADLARRAGVRVLEVRGHVAVLADPSYRTEREQKKRASFARPGDGRTRSRAEDLSRGRR